jgi:hypothetical protein
MPPRGNEALMTSFDLSWARGKLGPLTSECLNDHFEHGETSCFSYTSPKMDVVVDIGEQFGPADPE